MNADFSRIAYGLRILMPSHPAVRSLKRKFRPSNHGHKVWSSSWLLIDYLQSTGMVAGKRVLDFGCGWGLAGIYCAMQPDTAVMCTDVDEQVYPYLKLMAESNKVQVDFRHLAIDQIRRDTLRQIDFLIAADICFCDSLIDPIRRMIGRAKKAGIQEVLIADPGRWPFDDLAALFERKKEAELINWEAHRPDPTTGKILRIRF
jgi:predicted nicotinamide N-methyase